MKKRIVSTAVLYIVMLCLATAFAAERSYPFNGFTEIDFGISGKLNLSQSDDYSIVLEGSEEQIQEIVIRKNGNALEIAEVWSLFGTDPSKFDGVVVRVTIPRLDTLTVSGPGSAHGETLFTASDRVRLTTKSSGDLSLSAQAAEIEAVTLSKGSINLKGKTNTILLETRSSGSIFYTGEITEKLSVETESMGNVNCDLNPDVMVPESHLRVSSMGNITIKGKGRYVEARSSSAGDLLLKNFPSEHLKLDLNSSGNAFVNVTGALNINTSSTGRVINHGTPRID